MEGLKYKSKFALQKQTLIPKYDGTNIKTTTTVYDSDHIYITPQKEVMTGYFFFVYEDDGEGNITEYKKIADTDKYSLYAEDKDSDGLKMYIYHAEKLQDCKVEGQKTYFFDYGDKVTSGQLATFMYASPGITTGDGNNTVYMGNGSWLQAGAGDDVVYGDGTIETGSGNDKIFLSDDNLYMDGYGFTYYNVDGQGGNDYIDTSDVKGTAGGRVHTLNLASKEIVYGAEAIELNHSSGVDTLIVDPESDVPLHIYLWATSNEDSGKWNNRGSYNNRSNVYNNYTAFQRGDDLVLANGNGITASGGTLIVKDYYAKDEKGNDVFSAERKASMQLCFDPSFREENDYFLDQSYMTLDEFVSHVGLADYYEWEATNHGHLTDVRVTRENNLWFEVIDNGNGAFATINTPTLTQKEEKRVPDYEHFTSNIEKQDVARGKYIIGGKGAQTIYGGDGNDVIYGDDINGHDKDGNYIKPSTDGADVIYAGKGRDYVLGGGGNDFIDGGSGSDYLDGEDGNDTIVGGTAQGVSTNDPNQFHYKELHGGNGDDTIYSLGAYTDGVFDAEKAKAYLGGDIYFRNNIYGGAGNDTIFANAYNDMVYAGDGDDTVYSYKDKYDDYYNSNSSAEIYGGKGNDKIYLYGDAEQTGAYHVVDAYGEDGDDIIDARGSLSSNKLDGGKGNDIIYAGNIGSSIAGGEGDDFLYGGDGDDYIYGGEYASVIGQVHSQTDIIYAGKGNDSIFAGGSSKIYGEDGNDSISLATGKVNAPSNLYIDGGKGDDTYTTQSGYGFDTIVASEGNDVIEFVEFDKTKTSCQYRDNDLVISYTSYGYPCGLILKDYKLGGFENFTVKTYGDYYDKHAQNGEYTMTEFVNYLDNKYSMAENGTEGDDKISSKATINGLGGNDLIIGWATDSTSDNPQIINTGSGNNRVIAASEYNTVNGGTGNDEYDLRSIHATLIDEGGNNTVTVENSMSQNNWYYDITLKGNGNNTITGVESTYKITATGSGKQTINVSSHELTTLPVTNETVYTQITTGSGDDDITINSGTVSSGAGNDKITIKDYGIATLNGGAGNDSYIITGGYDWGESSGGISIDSTVLINDTEGSNDVKFTSNLITHDKLNLFMNVNSDGTLGQFKHYVYNPETEDNDIAPTGYSAFLLSDMDMKYAGTVAVASNNGWYENKGLKFADTATMAGISKIEASDGYYISQATISTITQNVAGWLSTNSYASVWDAIKPKGQSDFDSANYDTLYAMFNNTNTWTKAI